MKYLIHYEGSGEGCDHTIGCNHAVELIDANSMEEVIKKVACGFFDYPEGRDSWLDPDELKKVTIYEIARAFPLDLELILLERQETAAEIRETKRRKKEFALYERPREQYG